MMQVGNDHVCVRSTMYNVMIISNTTSHGCQNRRRINRRMIKCIALTAFITMVEVPLRFVCLLTVYTIGLAEI